MSRSGEEIQADLRKFTKRWTAYAGSERSEAQTFLNELFECYGTNRRDAGAKFEDAHASTGIMDLHWPGSCIVEMKAPGESERLEGHRKQALDYWHHSDDAAAGRPAPPHVVLCSFHRFEVWEPGQYPSAPRDVFTLDELPDRYESLLFLAGQEPLFLGPRRALTTAAAESMVALHRSLVERQADVPDVLGDFVLQLVWCLFAESLDLLPHKPLQQIVEGLLHDEHRSSAAELGHLFQVLNQPAPAGRGGPIYSDLPYVNGELFARPTSVHLTHDELALLADAAQFDWKQVDPTIFGSLLEGFIGRERRWETGVHYTHEADILKIVRPTIVEPWNERIAAISTIAEAEQALLDLTGFRVLDPACGCGNFLYVAYRELRELEHRIKARIDALYQEAGAEPPTVYRPGYPLANLHGIEIDEFPVHITRIVLWMGQKLAADRYGLVEAVLPLVSLSNIVQGDALKVTWPEADAIIGNPPFNGSQHLRQALGDDYVEWLKTEFGCGIKDYCVYWFRKASDHLAAGRRAGLVGTNSISQNRARSASLDYVVEHGGVITNAVSSQKWPGEAKVHVSLVNWIKDPAELPPRFELDGSVVTGITPALREGEVRPDPQRLAANAGHCFQGPIPAGKGFIVRDEEARALLARLDGDYSKVVRRFLQADDLVDDPAQEPRRWIVDFGSMGLEDSMRFPAALEIVKERVKPERDGNRDEGFRARWWQFGRPRIELRAAIQTLDRYVACARHGKRLLFAWCDPEWCAGDATNVFAFDDDCSFGILSSRVHDVWAWARSSTLETRLRYTPTSVFETFPWPDPMTHEQRAAIAAAARDIVRLRREVCSAEQIGLTALYNRMDDGAYANLRAAHRTLDEAVAAAYGWPKKIAQDPAEIVPRLLALNAAIAVGERAYAPFPERPAAPGVEQESLL